jgi:chemotaxis signal transduction protein/CheY-like chemotaxis protein
LKDKPTALLVEDNPVSLKIIAATLAKQGVQVTTAVSGKEAIESVKETAYDLIFMDIELPDMNGMETTKTIRKWESGRSEHLAPDSTPYTPMTIVAMTAHESEENRQACINAGMDAVETKPLYPEKLKEILERRFLKEPVENTSVSSHIISLLEKKKDTVEPRKGLESEVRHLMIFKLGKEKYALDMKHVKKVMWAKNITRVPGLPPHILGIINIRGEIISVVDMKMLLGLSYETAEKSSILITSDQDIETGLLVDSVDAIIDLPSLSIDPPMITFEKEYIDLIDGAARMGETFLIVLNYEKIIQSELMDIHKK